MYVGPKNKARYFQYSFKIYTPLADEVMCRSDSTVRNMDDRNDCSTECDYALIPLQPLNEVFYFTITISVTIYLI